MIGREEINRVAERSREESGAGKEVVAVIMDVAKRAAATAASDVRFISWLISGFSRGPIGAPMYCAAGDFIWVEPLKERQINFP
jgi:hypothetical protein